MNKIKTPNGLIWLTIPVQVRGKYHQKIKDVVISDSRWNCKHWKSIIHNYSKAKYFKYYEKQLEELYLDFNDRSLSQINYRFICAICQILGINTKLSWSMSVRYKW